MLRSLYDLGGHLFHNRGTERTNRARHAFAPLGRQLYKRDLRGRNHSRKSRTANRIAHMFGIYQTSMSTFRLYFRSP